MSPDDPRHGTEAGYSAHKRASQKACRSCEDAKLRGDKRRRVLGPKLQHVPADVLVILDRYSDRTLALRTGVSVCALQNMRRRGPKARAYPATIARLRSIRVPTDVGVVRRVQALTRLGWSAPQIADAAGVPYTTIVRLRDHADRQVVGRDDLRDGIATAYDALSMRVPPLSRWTSRLSGKAERAGWAPPLAWDEDAIDDPAANPAGAVTRGARPHSDLDHGVVDDILAGDYALHATPAERAEVCRRWHARGRSQAELSRLTGWRTDRYFHVTDQATAA